MTVTEQRLAGKVALVTGGASGIGAASAELLGRQGATVVIGDLNIDAMDASALRMDVADPVSVQNAIDAVMARHERLDCLVHSAGVARALPFLDTPVEEFDRMVAVNLRGTFVVGQASANAMLRSGGGSIVNVGSVSGILGSGRRAAYGSSKAGVIHLTKVMAVELARYRVRVNVICPGPISTPLVDAFYTDAIRSEWTSRVPMRRFGDPGEVAAVAAFLCSDEASYVTGQTVAIDGGFAIAGLRDDAV